MSTRVIAALLMLAVGAPLPVAAQAQSPEITNATAAVGVPPVAPSAEDPERIAKVRADANARRNGRRARIRLVDGSLAYGRIIGVQDNSLALQPTASDEPVMYEFARVRSIEGAGAPRWVWTALGVGAAAAVIGAVAAAN